MLSRTLIRVQKAMFIFTLLSTFLLLCCKIHHGNDEYNAFPSDWEQIFSVSLQTDQYLKYDIKNWMRSLQSEHCTFVESDERFCALFVEMHDSSFVTKIVDNFYVPELFSGFCGCFILHFGDVCMAVITKLRKSNCLFTEVMVYDNTSARAHQRLYNIFLLCTEIHVCNYSMSMANQQSYRIEGFPMCHQSPLPSSLCTLGNVYDVVKYAAGTINGINSIKCLANSHKKQLCCSDAGLWTFKLPVVTSSWSQWLYLICNNNYVEGQVVVVISCYNQVTCSIKLQKCFFIFLSTSDTMTAVRLTILCFSIIDCIQKDVYIYAFKERIDNKQEIDEVYNNDYKISPKDLISVRSLRRRLLQSIGYECYQNMDYNTQRGKSNYRRYAQYVAPVMRADKGENESEDEDEDEDDYEVSDEKADNNSEEDENEEVEEEEEEDNEFGQHSRGQWIRMERSNRKQKEYLPKENVRIRSVSKECNEEPTEELQYYDYEISGIDALFGNMHTLQIGYLTRLTAMHLLFTFII